MSQPTAKALRADASRIALIRNHGTDRERAVQALVGMAAVSDPMKQAAIRRAKANYPGEPLAWLNHTTGTVTPI